MPATVDHSRLLDGQLLDAWRAYRLACVEGRHSAAVYHMVRIDTMLDRLNASAAAAGERQPKESAMQPEDNAAAKAARETEKAAAKAVKEQEKAAKQAAKPVEEDEAAEVETPEVEAPAVESETPPAQP